MTKYREILRLRSLEFSERNIARSTGVSRNTVKKVLARADGLDIEWPLDFGMTDSALEELMFPREKSATNKRMPDFDYIRKELMRNGGMESTKSFSGMNTWRNAVRQEKKDSSIRNSAGTSSRMSRNVVRPCISPESLANRLKSTGLAIQRTSLTLIPGNLQMPGSLLA